MYQQQAQEEKEYSMKLEKHLHESVEEAIKFKKKIMNLESEVSSLLGGLRLDYILT